MGVTMTLDQAACHFETDKGTQQKRGGPGHGYSLVYGREFSNLQFAPPPPPGVLLEIGVQAGCSLRLWDWYFGAHWKIVGLEVELIPGIEEAVKKTVQHPDRVFIEKGDSTSFADAQRVSDAHGPFDVIIDDGDHLPASQKSTLMNFWPALKPGGLYIIEDLHESFWDEQYPSQMPRGSFLPVLHDLIRQCLGRGRFATWGPVPPMPPPEPSDNEIASIRIYRNIVVMEKYR